MSVNYKDNKYSIIYQKLSNPNFNFPINFPNNKTSSDNKIKIYYSDLITLEKIFENKKENKDIYECMSKFNFLPKYYYKFYKFEVMKKLEGEINISNIIDDFYKQEKNDIKYNINKYFSKQILMPKNEFEKKFKINIYKSLLNFQRSIMKTYEKSIPFYKLYSYSLKYPFKY